MTVEEIWSLYKKHKPTATSYEAWSFCCGGQMGDALAQLVLDGIKTATASAYDIYALEKSPLPSPGNLSVILWSNGAAACIIKTTRVTIARFS